MFDWPIIAPLITVAFGATVLLANRVFGNEKDQRTQWKIIFFILAAAAFQTSYLWGTNWGAIGSGLFSLDGFNSHLVLVALFYFLFSHISFALDVQEHESETGIFQMIFVLMAVAALLTNNMILLPISLATMFFITAIAPLLLTSTSKAHGIKQASIGASLVLIVSAVSSALIAESADSLLLNEIRERVTEISVKSPFISGFTLLILLLCSFLLLPPSMYFAEKYKKQASWALAGFFRQSFQLMAALLLIRLSFLIALKPEGGEGFVSAIHGLTYNSLFGGALCVFFLIASVTLLFAKNVFVFFQTLTCVLVLVALTSVNIAERDFIQFSQASLYLFVLISAGLFCLASVLKVQTDSTLEELREKLQGAPVAIQLSLLATLVVSVPAFGLSGFDLIRTMLVEAKKRSATESSIIILTLLCLFFISAIIALRISELFHGNAKRNNLWDDRSFPSKLWCYILILCLLFLGIYPTPLYKYLSHSVDLFVNNS